MTDEERAEEYYEDNECYSYLSEIEDFEEIFSIVEDRIKKAYLAGLEAGRKESEKENAGLKEKLKGFDSGEVAWQGDMDAAIKQNLELKKQNKIILEDNDTLNKWIDELRAQIEKLTCSKKYYCRESDGTAVPCFMTKLCADCQYREPKE